MQLFGFEIPLKKKKSSDTGSPVTPDSLSGEIVTASSAGFQNTAIDFEALIKNENELIKRYRDTAMYPDCDSAIEDIINEAIVCEEDSQAVALNLDALKVTDAVKKKFQDEFDQVLKLMKFDELGHDIFRSWYVDGRIYYNILLDPENPKQGITGLVYIDPRKIRRIKQVKKARSSTSPGTEVVESVDEYYIYNNTGISETNVQGLKMSLDSVAYCPSGFRDGNSGLVLSYLHKAIKPVNQLRMIEDAWVIYVLARAPSRRIFYIDVGNLPAIKAEQYVTDIMNKYRNKITYNASTGEVQDDRKNLSMLEDFWMARRGGGKGTEISTLPGDQSGLLQNDQIQYFQQKLLQSLNVPIGRLQPSQGFSLGRASEITRDELKFSKFISRIRKKFSKLFLDILRVQLISKGIVRADEWEILSQDIKFDFVRDNYFAEFKNNDLITQRLATLQLIDPFVGKYFSIKKIKKDVLMQTDEEIEEEEKQIELEDAAGLHAPQDTQSINGAPEDNQDE